MRIKNQIIVSVLGATALIGLVGAAAVLTQQRLAEAHAVTEATNVSRQFAQTIAFRPSDGQSSLFDRPEALREFVKHHQQSSNRDFIVVDRKKIILADSSDEERVVGQPFDEDAGNEVALTMEDGAPRHFVEDNHHAERQHELIVVPVEYPAGTVVGAVLLEYAPVLAAVQKSASAMQWILGAFAAAAMLAAVGLLSILLRHFNSGLSSLTAGMKSLAEGQAGTRITNASGDEFGELAKGFNAMAAELETSRGELLVQKSYVEDIVQAAAEGIVVMDGDGRVVSANPAAAAILGLRADRIAGQDWRSVITMEQPKNGGPVRAASLVELALTTGRQHQAELRLLRPDGTAMPTIASCGPLSSSQGGVVLTLSDISELRRAERVVSERANELANVNRELQEKSETTSRLVKLGELLQACVTFPEAFSVVGSAMADFVGGLSGTVHLTSASRNLVDEVAHWGTVRSSVAQFAPEDCWALRRGQEHISGPEILSPRCAHITENGNYGYVCMPLAAQGETLGILHLCEPNAAEKPRWLDERRQILRGIVDTLALALANLRLRETLRQQSIRDPNTGLFNRRYLEETSSRELRRMERSHLPLVMIMLDVDHFKQFNDTFGHEAGDLVLKQVAATMLDNAREADVVSRYGGEEFAVVMPGASLQEGIERAEALRVAVKQLHVTHRGRTLGTITMSLGVAAYPEHGASWSELANAADHALYKAKEEGRDRAVASGRGA
ncbi:diguanylate cyclase [Rhizobium sp. LjRoot254]|uniref:diguanylate cyclase n=1 Tax=Rhizobium sp. LjRoot254 TaxID=3342297 RepID=UPI003ECC4161